MNEIAQIILSANRRKLLISRPVFVRSSPVSEAELFRLATGLNFKFPLGLSKWLLLAGYGDIDEVLSFRENFFSVMKKGTPDGHVSFAQDTVGNQYVFSQQDGGIFYIGHTKQVVAKISDDFPSFMQELIRRDYRLNEWMSSISAK
jgi:hypothetical protein